MADREEMLKIIEDLKIKIDTTRREIEEKKEKVKRDYKSGTLMRTGIVILLLAIGIGIAAYFL